jgi:tetratricopeptide (TPR) repeat protein
VESATAEFLDSLRARPDDAHSHYNLGNYQLNRGNVSAATGSFETAHRLRPDLVPPLVNLAMAQSQSGRDREAEQSLRRALELEPESAAALFNLGLLLGEAGRFDEAAAAHRKALKADPELAAAAYNLGVILSAKEPVEALRWCRRAAELRPDEPKYAYTVAYYLQEQGDTNGAIAVLEKLIVEHPGYAEGWGALGSTYAQQGRIEDARALYRRAADNKALPMHMRRRFAALAP